MRKGKTFFKTIFVINPCFVIDKKTLVNTTVVVFHSSTPVLCLRKKTLNVNILVYK